MLTTLGPLCLGAMIGWSMYYFMRQYRLFNPKVLAGTVAAILGAPLLKFVGGVAGDEMQVAYLAGLGIGFFAYALYLGILLFLKHRGIIKDRSEFDLAAGCGAGIRHEIEMSEITLAARSWSRGEISDLELREIVQRVSLTHQDYERLAKEYRSSYAKSPTRPGGEDEIVIEGLNIIEKAGLHSELGMAATPNVKTSRRK